MVIGGLSAYAAVDEGSAAVRSEHQSYYLGNMQAIDAAIIRTIATVATTVALVYCHKRGREFIPVDPHGSFVGNMLLMMGVVRDTKDVSEVEKCLQRLWILYADHEMTNSTAAFLHAASTLTDPLSSTISGIVSAYGPLHGGELHFLK